MFGLDLPGPLPSPKWDLEEGKAVQYGHDIRLNVRHAPGHAPGHVIFVDEPGRRVLVGDVVFNGSIGRTDLPGGNHGELLRSIHREVLTLDDDLTLHPGHGPDTTVGQERANNPFLQGRPPENGG